MRQNRPLLLRLCWACALASPVTFLTGDHVMQIGFGQISPSASSTRDLETRLHNRLTERHAALVYCVLLWYWISMLWSTDTCQNKVSADQYHVTISRAQVNSSSRTSVFWRWPLTRCWIFDWIAGSCLVHLLKTGQDYSGSRLMLTQDQTLTKL